MIKLLLKETISAKSNPHNKLIIKLKQYDNQYRLTIIHDPLRIQMALMAGTLDKTITFKNKQIAIQKFNSIKQRFINS